MGIVYNFLDYTIDTTYFELLYCGEAKSIGPKPFDLLLYLIKNSHRTVSRDELREAVWKGNLNLTRSAIDDVVQRARQAVGDNGRTQVVIKTVSKRGYRFVAPFNTSGNTRVSKSVF